PLHRRRGRLHHAARVVAGAVRARRLDGPRGGAAPRRPHRPVDRTRRPREAVAARGGVGAGARPHIPRSRHEFTEFKRSHQKIATRARAAPGSGSSRRIQATGGTAARRGEQATEKQAMRPLGDWTAYWAKRTPDATALHEPATGRRWSYREL